MSIQTDELLIDKSRMHSRDVGVQNRADDCALPIVIGVTGHRHLDPASVRSLEGVVAKLFDDVRRDYPSSPLVVLSPLAEGADRLVARIGLAAGANLVVPLPFDPEHYRSDFATDESQREFDDFVARASRHFVLPLLDGHAAESTADAGLGRDLHYAQVGAYIARTSQILIALWDGDTRVRKGGTADVVYFRLHGAPPELVPVGAMLDAPLSGPLYHVVTPSPTTPVPQFAPLSVRTMYPSGYESDAAAATSFSAKLQSFDRFNRDERKLRSRLAAARVRSRESIAPTLMHRELDVDERQLVERFVVADTLALHYGRRSLFALIGIIAGVFVAVLAFEIYGHLLPNEHWLLGGYLAALIVAWLVQRVAGAGEYQAKYLDYRALAEGLRVQLFWWIAGLHDDVADHYMRKQRSVLDWIRDAIRTWSIGGEARTAKDSDVAASEARFAIVI
ncbi:MAG: hypothetical protein H7X80_11035, partial [bacterium]|nr:hypothetical protein [Candidatus Kapabacteria bacterium]